MVYGQSISSCRLARAFITVVADALFVSRIATVPMEAGPVLQLLQLHIRRPAALSLDCLSLCGTDGLCWPLTLPWYWLETLSWSVEKAWSQAASSLSEMHLRSMLPVEQGSAEQRELGYGMRRWDPELRVYECPRMALVGTTQESSRMMLGLTVLAISHPARRERGVCRVPSADCTGREQAE